VGVDAGLQALAVDVVGDGAHAAGPLTGVDGDVAVAVPGALPPALVDVDVPVAGGGESGRDERVDLLLDDVVIDLRGEAVPGGPAHGGGRDGHLAGRRRLRRARLGEQEGGGRGQGEDQGTY